MIILQNVPDKYILIHGFLLRIQRKVFLCCYIFMLVPLFTWIITHTANIVPYEIQSTPPSNVSRMYPENLFDHPGDVLNWRSREVPKWGLMNVLILRPRDVPSILIRDVPRTFSGRPLEELQNMSYRQCRVIG